MAVNRITNKQVVNKELVNRAKQVSTKNTTIRGNRETTIIPGNNFSENYAITLKDVDTTVLTTGNLNAKLQSASGIMLTYVPASTSLEVATSGQILAHMSGATASATAAGELGEIRFDTTHIYIAIGTNVWKRVGISTF